ncbi:AraC family transcriptional regulator [Brucella anthropi]|uniref:AraC family transcriptional regulator n=1 Tax=Brucella anthropi TaxID=529 RepID=UPI001CFDDD2E|nr:AraC family transcriptional regulator [Brucella anthropi]
MAAILCQQDLEEVRPAEDDRGLRLYTGRRWQRLLSRAAAALNDPCLGLHLGQRVSPAHLGVLGYALSACSDLGGVLSRWQQYDRLIAYVAKMDVRAAGDVVVIEWISAPEPLGALVDEAALTAIVQFSRDITGQEIPVREVSFINAHPEDTRPYLAYFGCPVLFGQPVTRLCFEASALQLPLRQPDAALFRILEQQAQSTMAALPPIDDLEHTLRQAIARLARNGEVSIERVACDMRVTSRTLHRRLARLGLQFSELRDDTLRRLAVDYLRDPRLSQGEIAWLLGYSEHSAFTRAFRRWTGQSPQQWRLAKSQKTAVDLGRRKSRSDFAVDDVG